MHSAMNVCQHSIPDVVLLDINVPLIGGLEVAKQLDALSLTPIPKIFITANRNPLIKRAALSADQATYVEKPFSTTDLLEKIEETLAAARDGKPHDTSSDCFFRQDDQWFFQTREGARGPFKTREDAERELRRFIDTIEFVEKNEQHFPAGIDLKNVTIVDLDALPGEIRRQS